MSEPAGRYSWDLDTPHPNVELEALRVAVRQAIGDLETTVAGVQAAQAGVDDTYWLSDLLFSLLDGALAAVTAATADRDQLRADLQSLTDRVVALEAPEPPAPAKEGIHA